MSSKKARKARRNSKNSPNPSSNVQPRTVPSKTEARAGKTQGDKPVKRAAEKKKPEGEGVVALVAKGARFLREAKAELKKVKWPTRKELLASTAMVIILTLIVAFFLGVVDMGLIKIIRALVG